MFKESLENKELPDSLAGQLAVLCDAYYEFHNVCAFIQHAQSLIDKEPMELDEAIAEGISVCGRSLRDRSEAIMLHLNDLHKRAKKASRVD